MKDDLLAYYERELAWFKQASGHFAENYPKIAAHLKLSADIVEDPHVSRLIESVALLNARIQSRIDEDFPAITEAMLEHLYPHYLAPIPSMFIVELIATEGLDALEHVPVGTEVQTDPVDGLACRFRTVLPVDLLPYKIATAKLLPRPFVTPLSEKVRRAASVLTLELKSNQPEFSLAENERDYLDLHLRSSQVGAWRLYDLLNLHCLGIVVTAGAHDDSPILLSPTCIEQPAFNDGYPLLVYGHHAETAYRYLTELFALPEKFLFLRINGLQQATRQKKGSLTFYFYFGESDRELERTLNDSFFSLSSTPVINLFSQACEPIAPNAADIEYLALPDSRFYRAFEIQAIEQVNRIEEATGESVRVAPFHGMQHVLDKQSLYWHGRRRPSLYEGRADSGYDYYLSLSHLNGDTPLEKGFTVSVQALCSNRNLPVKLPYGGGQPKLFPSDSINNLREIRALSAPSQPRRLDLGHGTLWRLIAHLNLNLTSLTHHRNPAEPLRELLRLYDYSNAALNRALVNAIETVSTHLCTVPLRQGNRSVICQGVDVEIVFNDSQLAGFSLLLFGEVLNHFLASYVSINSFTQLTTRIKGKEGIFKRWPPSIGIKTTL